MIRPVPLFEPDNLGIYNDIGVAVSTEFRELIRKPIRELLKAGYDKAHLEVCLSNQVLFELTFAVLFDEGET